MKTAVIIHWMPSKEEYFDPKNPAPSHNHWFPWLPLDDLPEALAATANVCLAVAKRSGAIETR